MELPAWPGVDLGPTVFTVVLQAGDVGTEEGGKLASTPRTLALITHLVVQHVWFNLHLEQDNDGIESSNDKKKQ